MVSDATYSKCSNYQDQKINHSHAYILPDVMDLCADLPPDSRVLDIGCGDGKIAYEFLRRGHSVVGIDLDDVGIRFARQRCPAGRFELLAADSSVLKKLNEAPFDLVYSIEVIEHLYDPRGFMAGCFHATKPGGRFLLSTPYHGYLKNLALSIAGKWDHHADPLFDGGHIKLFSRAKLSNLMIESGFDKQIQFRGSGRVPYLWMSMLLFTTRPK